MARLIITFLIIVGITLTYSKFYIDTNTDGGVGEAIEHKRESDEKRIGIDHQINKIPRN